MISTQDLARALAALNATAEAINLGRRYEVTPGSRTQGTSYYLHEFNPAFTHSVDMRIGGTRAEAEAFLRAIAFAFERIAAKLSQPKAVDPALRGALLAIDAANRSSLPSRSDDIPQHDAGWPPQDS
jgi:hypothetical protein